MKDQLLQSSKIGGHPISQNVSLSVLILKAFSNMCLQHEKQNKTNPKKTFLSTTTKENPSLRKYILVVPCLITRKKAIYNLINCD